MITLELVENALYNIETTQKLLSRAGVEQVLLSLAIEQLKTAIIQLEVE